MWLLIFAGHDAFFRVVAQNAVLTQRNPSEWCSLFPALVLHTPASKLCANGRLPRQSSYKTTATGRYSAGRVVDEENLFISTGLFAQQRSLPFWGPGGWVW